MPTRRGRGATARTVDNDISSGGMLPIASDDEFASKERGHKPDDDKAAGAAAFRTRQVAALARGGLAAGARHSADGVFVRAARATTMRLQPPQDDRMEMPRERQGCGSSLQSTVKAAGAASQHPKWPPRPGMGRPLAQNARRSTDRMAMRDATRASRPQERPSGHAKWPPRTGMGQLPAQNAQWSIV